MVHAAPPTRPALTCVCLCTACCSLRANWGLATYLLQVLHVAFALWAYSVFGVPQSPLVTGTFASLVRAACNATEAGWKAVSGFGDAVLAERLLSEGATHLLMVLLLMVGVLFLKLTLTRWIQVGGGRVDGGFGARCKGRWVGGWM